MSHHWCTTCQTVQFISFSYPCVCYLHYNSLHITIRPIISRSLTDSVLAEIACFHDYGQELDLNLPFYLHKRRKITKSDESKDMLTKETKQKWLKKLNLYTKFLDRFLRNQIWWIVIHFHPCNPSLYLQTTASVFVSLVVYLVTFFYKSMLIS